MNDALSGVTWYHAQDLGLRGMGWLDETRAQPFDRLPQAMEALIEEPLWRLSCQSAGLYVDFRCATTELFIRWQMADVCNPLAPGDSMFMSHCGRHGIDCYGRDHAGSWRWVGGKEAWQEPVCDGRLNRTPLDGGEREYRVYLPLMRRLLSCEIGVRGHLQTVPADPRKPIAYYGTSIVHGSGVGRAGMTHAAQLARSLDREILNLGFCGRAFCELAMADALGRLDPCLYLIDVLPNNSAEALAQRLPPFLERLRQARPRTPTLLIGDRVFGDAAFAPQRDATFRDKNRALDEIVSSLRDAGMSGLHLSHHPHWFGSDGEGSGDGSHPNDLGAWRMAQALRPAVAALLS